MSIKFKTKKKIKRALFLSAPFFLAIIAVVFFSVWGFNKYIRNNVFYQILTDNKIVAETQDETEQPQYYDESEMEKLKESLMADSQPEVVTTSVIATTPYYVPEEEYYEDPEYYPDDDYSSGDYSLIETNEPFPPIFIGEQFATISIPSAQVSKVAVFHGDSDDLLKKGVGHYSNSRFPGQKDGTIVIPGHVGYKWAFQRLEKMHIGDLVYLDTYYGGRYVFKVYETYIFDETDPSYLKQPLEQSDRPADLICYTCYPYRTSKVRTQRFAIKCELISGTIYPEVGT